LLQGEPGTLLRFEMRDFTCLSPLQYLAGTFEQRGYAGLTHDVAETYAPVQITVAYAGQTPVPRPFLMILNWIRTPHGWRMASDIALPVPAPPHS